MELLRDDQHILQAGEVGAQVYLQAIAEAVRAILDGADLTHEDAGREDRAEAARLYRIANLEARMTGNIVKYRIEWAASFPSQITEIGRAAQAAADVGAAVQ